jgi:hypothetical protein
MPLQPFRASIDAVTLFTQPVTGFPGSAGFKGAQLFLQYELDADPANFIIRVSTAPPTRKNTLPDPAKGLPTTADVYFDIDGTSTIVTKIPVHPSYKGGDLKVTASVTQTNPATRWHDSHVTLDLVEKVALPATKDGPLAYVLVEQPGSTAWDLRWVEHPVFLSGGYTTAEAIPPEIIPDPPLGTNGGGIGLFGPMGIETP